MKLGMMGPYVDSSTVNRLSQKLGMTMQGLDAIVSKNVRMDIKDRDTKSQMKYF